MIIKFLKLFLFISSFGGGVLSEPLTMPLTIGVLVPLKGYIADYGVAFKNGMDLAISEKSNIQVNNVKFIFEDSSYDAKLSLSAFNKLLTVDKVDMVFVWGSTPSAVVAPLAKQKQIPIFTFTGVSEIGYENDFVIDFTSRLEDFAKTALVYLRSKGHKNFGIIKTEIHYLEALTESIKLSLSKDESLIIVDSFQPAADVNFNASLLKIKRSISKKEIDTLGVFLSTGQLSTFFQKMAQQKISINKFGTDFMLQKDEMRRSGEAAIGTIFATIDMSKDFSKKYINKYNTDQQISYAAQGYDISNLLFQAYGLGITNKNPQTILENIESIKSYDGVLGKAEFIKEDPAKFKNPGKRFNFPIVIKEVVEAGESVVKRE